jgi:hypothetical protein
MQNDQRGFAWVPVLIVMGVAALLVPHFHLPAMFQKQPPTAKLTAAQDELAAAKASQAKAEALLASAQKEAAQRTAEQLDYAQGMSAGAGLALARVKPEQLTPEIKLATDLTTRANAGLAAARGKLPADQQAEMQKLIDEALSAVTAERDAYKADLAKKDAALAAETQARAKAEAAIPTLQANEKVAEAAVTEKVAEVQTATNEVKVWAEKKAASDAKAGGLEAWVSNAIRLAIVAGLLYALVHFVLPSLAVEFPGGFLATVNKWTKSIFSAHP